MSRDIIDLRMPGLLKSEAEVAQGETRRELAKQLAEIDAGLGDELPSDDWFANARNVDVMAVSMRFWCKRGAPPALIARAAELARRPGLEGRLFARIKENIHVQ